MQIHAAPRATLRRGLFSLALALAVCAGTARADDLKDADRFLKAGQHSQALDSVNKALRIKPRDPQARFLKAVILTEQGNSKEAIEIFTKLTQDFPELPEPYNNLAVIYAAQGQYEKARAALEQSIRTHPSYATAYENLGDVYAKLASQAYDKALQLDKTNTGAQNKLSLVREIARAPATLVAAAKEPAKEQPAREPAKEQPAKEPAKPALAALEQTKPAAKPAPVADSSAAVLSTVESWAKAWSSQDVEGYLAHYAPSFETPKGQSRADWEKLRRARVGGPKWIKVAISSPKVTMQGADKATVTFRQAYSSDSFKATGNKTLVLIKSEGRWLIQDEDAG